jgi:hypothetical protein
MCSMKALKKYSVHYEKSLFSIVRNLAECYRPNRDAGQGIPFA